MMLLIADSGATKTEWTLVDTTTNISVSIITQGISPFYQQADEIFKMLEAELFPRVSEHFIEKIFFYGTGCSQPDKIEVVYKALNKSFPQAEIIIEHDLLAAAKAVCGNESGIACILGTGSNTCLFDGKEIIDNIPSLGFMLGDEGSGAYFGRKILQSFFYRELPTDLSEKFQQEYNIDKTEVLNNVYEKPYPNRYVASFMPFVNNYNQHPFINKLLADGINEFIEKFIVKYKGHENLPVHFIGSVAYLNQQILSASLHKHKLKAGRFLQSPMEGLLTYHLQNHAS
jgi:N-acetylglucosamine kinase-like BadF-type ATPase